jgi:hypothetical protein
MYPQPLPSDNSFASHCAWIKEHVLPPGGIIPKLENLSDGMKKKGLYFWFMNPKCYETLSKYVRITALKEVCILDGWHLVYIGSSGTGKQGKSTIYDRLKWHLTDKHTKAPICNGTLSTFRGGLGSLIADDLILPNTEEAVNKLLAGCFKVYYISYDRALWNKIDSDEKKLIQIIRPLLNIKNNPNASLTAPANSTQKYRARRIKVYESSRKKHCDEYRAGKELSLIEPDPSPLFVHQILKQDGCTEYIVLATQNIHVVTSGIPNLPIGACIFAIIDPISKWQVYAPQKGFWRRTGGRGTQNIYTYFRNVDTATGLARWMVIQKEMKTRKIKEVTVIVCVQPGKPLPPPPQWITTPRPRNKS